LNIVDGAATVSRSSSSAAGLRSSDVSRFDGEFTRVRSMRISCLLLALCFCLIGAGCGSGGAKGRMPVYKVTGKVTFNGAPVVGADVTFLCTDANKSAFGRTNDEGVYNLTTYSSNDGAVEGRHAVAIVHIPAAATDPSKPLADVTSDDYAPPEENQSTDPVVPVSTLPKKYGDVATSGLSAVVAKDDENVHDFVLTP
jgi:hypothetical protein